LYQSSVQFDMRAGLKRRQVLSSLGGVAVSGRVSGDGTPAATVYAVSEAPSGLTGVAAAVYARYRWLRPADGD
jgi:hypothetical protein